MCPCIGHSVQVLCLFGTYCLFHTVSDCGLINLIIIIMWTGPRPTFVPSGILIHPAVLPQQTWAENWGLCPFKGGGAGFPSTTMWPGTRPISVSSFILIHPTVWPQYTNVTDRQDRQTGQRSDSIGRTVSPKKETELRRRV